jgi:nitroreductase
LEQIIREIEQRRVKRALSTEKIPDEIIRRIMTAATYAPSCQNNQSWRFLVATEEGALSKVHEALSSGNYWARKAPLVVLVATKHDLDCRLSDGRDYAFFDTGLAAENLILQAESEGLHAHPMAGFDPLSLKQSFQIPDDYTVITLIAIGRPGDDSHLSDKHRTLENGPRERKPASEVISYNQWDFDRGKS